MIKAFILDNWALILILGAFAVSLRETVFLNKTTIRRMYTLIIEIFLLAIVVSAEFYLADHGTSADVRAVLMAVRYSATPFIIAQVIYSLTKKFRWYIFIPAIVLAVIDVISIFTGIVFRIGDDNTLHRGPLGFLPFIMVGVYCVLLIYILIKRSNKQVLEIIPIAFLGFAFVFGLIFPFIYGSDYFHIFCITIAISLFVYYVFSILKLTKIDPLTRLLNRQAFYADIEKAPDSITAAISIDMNGLKAVNDIDGHAAGDEALSALAACFLSARKKNQLCYRVGGDEFIFICRQTSRGEMLQLVNDIRKNVADTKYSCSIGYCHISDGVDSVDSLLQRSDEKMYKEKAIYYSYSKRDRRSR